MKRERRRRGEVARGLWRFLKKEIADEVKSASTVCLCVQLAALRPRNTVFSGLESREHAEGLRRLSRIK